MSAVRRWVVMVVLGLSGGILLDKYPGVTGYQYLYLATAGMCVIGLVAATIIYKRYVGQTQI